MADTNIDILNEKVKQLEKNCENIYEQITELRTTIQEIYGEISQSDRFNAKELLYLSSRLEELAKQFSKDSKNFILDHPHPPSNVTVTMSPNISPTMQNSQDNSSTSKENVAPVENKKSDVLSFLNLDLKTLIFFLIVGFLVSLGFVINFIDKIHAVLDAIK